jgi:uncharacterized cupredoxin-like copper-binding protein
MPGEPTRFKRMALAGLALVALLGGACGGDDDDAASESPAVRAETFGRAAAAAEATRTIELKMTDELTFEPATINVKKGETITFKVTNAGAMAHEMTIGGEPSQDLHEAQMLAMMMGDSGDMEDMEGMDHAAMGHATHGEAKEAPSADEIAKLDKKAPAFKSLHLDPGQTGELTWSFEGEPPLIGCHLPGHYDGGMKGEIVYA